ncbi:MAG: hypothetical protein ACOY40_10875 [Bacillota bacterium]
MDKKGNWFPIPRRELYLLLFLVLYPTIFFLPWSYNIMVLNVSLLAWGAYALFFLAPIISIITLMNGHRSSEKTESKKNLGV